MGRVVILVDIGREERQVDMPDLRISLLSVAILTDYGFEVHFRNNDAIVVDKDQKVHIRADQVGNLYQVRNC